MQLDFFAPHVQIAIDIWSRALAIERSAPIASRLFEYFAITCVSVALHSYIPRYLS